LQRDFDADDTSAGVMPLLKRMAEIGLGIKDVNTQQSSLEDIFVSLVHDRTHDTPQRSAGGAR
jgi:ABC-2 type transport system ATP-binding protein